jgi:glycosyltransferase involved in cell wall biosynthesis
VNPDEIINISVISAVYRAEKKIYHLMNNARKLSPYIQEHIIVLRDPSFYELQIINNLATSRTKVYIFNEPGLYRALNYGISKASGDFISLLHAGDVVNIEVHANLVRMKNNYDVYCFGVKLLLPYYLYRKYKPYIINRKNIRSGIMPPHTGMIVSKKLINKIGHYNEEYNIASDFDFVIRVFNSNPLITYLPCDYVIMEHGGLSNGSIIKEICKAKEISCILGKHKIKPLCIDSIRKIIIRILELRMI